MIDKITIISKNNYYLEIFQIEIIKNSRIEIKFHQLSKNVKIFIVNMICYVFFRFEKNICFL